MGYNKPAVSRRHFSFGPNNLSNAAVTAVAGAGNSGDSVANAIV